MSLTSYINNLTWNSNAANASDWRAVTWGGPTGNKKFAAVAGTTITGLSKVAVSTNGYEWTSTVDTPGTLFSTQCNKVLWDSVYKRFFVGGSGTNTLGFSQNASGLSWVGLGSSGNGTGNINTSVNSIASNNKSLRLVAVGKGTNSIAYSDAALPLTGTWTPVTGNTIFSDQGNAVLWFAPKNIWVAVGQGTNTIATSPDGVTWTGRGNSVFSVAGYGVAFNPTKAIAFGQGTNTIAYSLDGISWYGLGSTVFSTAMYSAVWTGTLWHGVGQGTNTIAYSFDGLYWTGLGSNIFTVAGYSITWVSWANIVAVGEGTNTLAQTNNGITWNGLGSNMFSVAGYGIATNGIQLVAVGKGTNTIIYSNNGTNWFPTGSNVFTDSGYSIAWSGTNWVALGSGSTNTAAYSPDGIVWTGLGNLFSTLGRGIYAKTPEIVVVGTGSSTTFNNIAYSPNGIWFWGLNALMSSLTFSSVLSVANNGSTSAPFWVAGGQSTPTLAYSSDGFSWTSLGTSVFITFCTGVAYGNGTWVAGGSGVNGLAWSTNGTGWNGLASTVFSTGNGVAYAVNSPTNKWVAVGGGTNTVAYSTNGRSWSGAGSLIFGNLGQGVANNNLTVNNRWVAVGGSGGTADSIGYSDNVTSWTATGRAVFIGSIAAFTTTLAVASVSVGTITVGMEITGTGIASGTRIVAYNAAVDLWIVNKAIGTDVISATITGRIFFTGYGVAHNGKNDSASFLGEINGTTLTVNGAVTGTIVVGMGLTGTGVATNTVIVSRSGTSWTVNISQTVNPAVAITGNTGRWAAVGLGSTTEGGNTIAYSNDGILWNGLGTTIFTQEGRCVTYCAPLGIWVAGGYSLPVPSFFSFAYSYDGVNWTGVPESPKILSQVYGVSWNGAYFIASGNNSNNTVVFAYSLNGINWFGYGRYSSITSGANDVAYNQDQNTWVSVGNGTSANSICFSPNGVNWIGLGNTIFTTLGNGVTWKGSPVNKWVTVGVGASTRFADSPDGLNWTSRGFGPFGTTAFKVIYTDNKFVAVGQGAAASIANSPDGISWTGVSGSLGITSVGNGLGYDAANNRVVAVGTRGNIIFSTTGFGVGYGGSDSAIFTGSIASTTLTVSFIMSGAISIGMTLTGTGVTPGTTISTGSGLSWTITPSQTVASTQMTGTRDDTVSFTGSITGTSLVVNSVTSGTVLLGMTVTGTGVVPGTVISAGLSSSYLVSISQNTATFTGTINNGSGSAGNILTVTSNLLGTILIGTTVTGGSTAAGTVIVSGSGNTWTVSGAAQLVSSSTLTTGAFAGNCVFNGTITGSALSVSSVTSGFLIIGMRLTGVGVSANTLIVSGSGTNWTVNTSQNVTTTMTGTFSQMLTGTSGLFVAGGNGTNTLAYSGTGKIWQGLGIVSPATPFTTQSYGAAFNAGAVGLATFNGTVSGTTLTITSGLVGTIQVGMGVTGAGVTLGTVILTGSGTTWTLNVSSTVSVAVAMRGSMNRWVGVGNGTNTLAYSNDGINWVGAGNTIIGAQAFQVVYSPMVLLTGGTGGLSSTVLTVTSVDQGYLYIGMPVAGTGIAAGTTILNQLTDTGSQPWTTGTYTMSTANTVTNGTSITGGNVWVAVGQTTNSIAYSLNNGVTWLGVGTTMLTNRGAGVAFGGPTGQKQFVAVGLSTQVNGNRIAYSTNGVVWQGVQNSGYLFSTACNGVAYGGAPGQEKFVAVGQGTNTFAYSFDGVTWTAAGGAAVSLIGYSVLWSSTKQIWLAGVNSPNSFYTPNGYAYSYDGIVWYGASAPANFSSVFSCNGLSYGKGVFVSVNNSSFGYLTYADEEAVNSLGDFNWVPIGFNTLGVSNDGGSTWSGVTRTNSTLLTGYTAAYNGTKWILGGAYTSACTFLYSDNTAKIWGTFSGVALYNVKWFSSISQFLLSLNGAGLPTSVARSASSLIARSSDGVDWTWCDMGAINNMAFTTVAGTPATLVFGSFAERMSPPLIVCCGRSSMSNSLNASMVLRSTDGVTWTRNIYPFQTSFILYVPFAVNPRFMVLSGNFINTSSDAVTWTPTRLFDDRMNATAAVWAQSLSKVCVISNATNYSVNNAAVSSDGVTWEYGTIPGNSFTALEWSPELAIFCALLNTDRNQQECLISGDGKNWYNTNSLNTNNSFNGLVWSPELQVFCGMGYNAVARPYGYVSKLLQ